MECFTSTLRSIYTFKQRAIVVFLSAEKSLIIDSVRDKKLREITLSKKQKIFKFFENFGFVKVTASMKN